jgi:hypothetical protein
MNVRSSFASYVTVGMLLPFRNKLGPVGRKRSLGIPASVRPGAAPLLVVTLVLIFGFGRQPAQEELLRQVGERSLAGVDQGIPEH